MKLSKSFKFLNHLFEVNAQKMPPLYTIGITNETEDCMFVPFFDLDNIYRETAIKYIRMAQREFDLSPAILLCSSGEKMDEQGRLWGNYMALFFDKMRYHDIIEILKAVPVIDWLSIKMPPYYRYKSWVLRMADKFNEAGDIIVERPEYVQTVYPENRNYLKHKHSEAHHHFLQKLFNFEPLKLTMDGYYELTFIQYNTKGKTDGRKVKTGVFYYPEWRDEFRDDASSNEDFVQRFIKKIRGG